MSAAVKSLLVVVAHPDDEAFGCGSVLARAARSGMRTAVLCATRGELGEPAPGSGVSRADLGRVREAELRAAGSLLGVGRVDLLDFTDSGVEGAPAPGSLADADPARVRSLVAAHLEEIRPDVVVTLDASDGHRDHAELRFVCGLTGCLRRDPADESAFSPHPITGARNS